MDQKADNFGPNPKHGQKQAKNVSLYLKCYACCSLITSSQICLLFQPRTYFYKQQSKLWNVRCAIPKSYKFNFFMFLFEIFTFKGRKSHFLIGLHKILLSFMRLSSFQSFLSSQLRFYNKFTEETTESTKWPILFCLLN